jgi:outer membrane protein insertion porin family/translocation and assembly module TamA
VGAWLATTLLLCSGCASIPEGRSAVDEVDITGNDRVDEDDILEHIATQENPRFLGIFEGVVVDYSVYNRHVLERDLARVERYYRARGHYRARVRAGRVFQVDDDEVHVEIIVEEGPAVRVSQVTIEGLDALPDEIATATRSRLSDDLAKGDVFEEESFEKAETDLQHTLADEGYAWVRVKRDASVDLIRSEARVTFRVDPGPVATFGQVHITGLGELPEEPVRNVIGIEPGERYSRARLVEAEEHLLDMGVFASVSLEPDLGERPSEPDHPVDIAAKTKPAQLRTISVGGGVRVDALQSDVHVLTAWESRNFLGGARKFRVEVRPGVTLYPLRINNWVLPEKPLPKGRLSFLLEQPDMLEPRTRGIVEPKASVYPVLLNPDPLPDDPVLGYLDAEGAVGLVRRIWKLHVAARHHLRYALPFAYQGDLNPLLSDVILAYPELAFRLDLRDNPAQPHSGLFASLVMESALAGDGRDFKMLPEVRGYIPLGDHVTLTAKAGIGLLFPFDYADGLESFVESGEEASDRSTVRDLQLLFFRGLFAGGPSSNRGYPTRTISPYGVVPFLNPSTEAERLACERNQDEAAQCAVPVGGLTLWEASIALRFEIYDPLHAALFCDAADVSAGQASFRFDYLRLSCGPGLRYNTPVGPIRLDVAYRIPGAQVIGEEDGLAGNPGTIFGAPINISFGIGEAF